MSRDNPLYEHSSIARRPRLELPGGARVAFWVGLNVEHFRFGAPALSLAPFTAQLVPDPLNHGWRDYGVRVGVWRLMEIFDALEVPVSAIVNADVCIDYPEIVEEGLRRRWAIVAHGRDNSTWQAGLEEAEERDQIAGVLATWDRGFGVRPKGWLGPVLTATMRTYDLLSEAGFTYVLDWANDDQPYDLRVRTNRLISIPYASEVNDIPIFHLRNQTGEDFCRALIDQFDVLYEEGARTGRVMGIGLHTFLVGQPFRSRYLARALEHVRKHDQVWLATSDQIADWYLGRGG
jgi:allantoinase